MKKLIVICMFFILGSGCASSQNFATENGAVILGGSAGFSSFGSEGSSGRSTSFSLYPVCDFFITQNLFVGGSLTLSINSSSGSDYTSVGIGPEIGYAFGAAKSSMFPFVKAGFNYMSSSTTYNNSKTTYSGTTITIGGGMVFEIVKHVGIVGLLSYNIMNTKYESSSSSGNSIELSFGIYGLLYK